MVTWRKEDEGAGRLHQKRRKGQTRLGKCYSYRTGKGRTSQATSIKLVIDEPKKKYVHETDRDRGTIQACMWMRYMVPL